MPAKVPASPPIRVEIRYNGRIKFAGSVYDPAIEQDDDGVKLTASSEPRMVKAPTQAPVRFEDDARNQEEVIQRVHSGRRDLPAPKPEKAEPEKTEADSS
jgi:hypothetical protein